MFKAVNVRLQKYQNTRKMTDIFTIGYGNRSVNTFTNLLTQYGIVTLIDVRSNPRSRFNPSYNMKSLQIILQSIGIEYLYMGAILGGKPKDQNLYKNGKLDYETVNSLSTYKAALNQVIELAEYRSVCLCCCELNPNNCHRKNLIADSLSKSNIIINHINERGLISPHSNFRSLNLF